MRTWHTAIPLLLLAVSLSVAPFTSALLPVVLLLCVAVTGDLHRQGAVLGARDGMDVGRRRRRSDRAG